MENENLEIWEMGWIVICEEVKKEVIKLCEDFLSTEEYTLAELKDKVKAIKKDINKTKQRIFDYLKNGLISEAKELEKQLKELETEKKNLQDILKKFLDNEFNFYERKKQIDKSKKIKEIMRWVEENFPEEYEKDNHIRMYGTVSRKKKRICPIKYDSEIIKNARERLIKG